MAATTDLPSPDPIAAHHDDLLVRHLRACFGVLDEAALATVRQRLRWVRLGAGETLMRQGEPGDALYLVVSGRLRVYIDADGRPRPVREITRGEVVGEMSLYTDAPRSATLVAIRDTLLVALGKREFLQLQAASPQVSMALMRRIISRLQTERAGLVDDRPVTMALLPVSEGVDATAFAAALARQLALQLGGGARVDVLDAAAARQRLAVQGLRVGGFDDDRGRHAVDTLLDAAETAADAVLLVADTGDAAWARHCSRHADEILLLADAAAPPRLHALEQALIDERGTRSEANEILVLLHADAQAMPRHTAAWLDRRPVADHLHVRPAVEADVARLARFQARTAVGLVLSGGGARGFAHLGVWQALDEAGIAVDAVGGTSIGAVMAAAVGSGLTPQQVLPLMREGFARNPTGDFTLMPLVSLIKGRRLRAIVGDGIARMMGRGARLEDLRLPCFCIASNASQAREVVLDRGDLLHALLASAAIPGALPPVLHDGDLLCDGGSFDNFPVERMRRRRGIGRVVGVDLGTPKRRPIALDELPGGWALLLDRLKPRRWRRYRLPSLASLMVNATILVSSARQDQARAQCDLFFAPPLERVGLLDWKRFDAVVAQGLAHAREVLKARG